MKFVKSKAISWMAVIMACGLLLSIIVSHLVSLSTELQSGSAQINNIIYSDDYRLSLSDEEKLWLNNHSVIRLGISRAFPPFGSMTKDNKYIGFSADYMRLIEYRIGIKFDIKKNSSWSDTIDMAKQGKLDMIAAIVNTTERQQFLNFSEPYVYNPTSIFSMTSRSDSLSTLDAIKGKFVAIEAKSYSADEIKRKYPEINLLLLKNTALALEAVSSGKADAYVGNRATASYVIQKQGYYNLSVAGDTEFFSTHSIGIIKQNTVLKSILNKTLSSISQKNKTAMENYWFGMDSSEFLPKKVVHITGALLATFLLFFAIWSRSLHKTQNELKRSKEVLKIQAEVDNLTKLGNRIKFYQQVERRIEHKSPFVLLFLDLDMFKEINESFGHRVGDLLLVEASKRLKESTGDLGVVSRIGSDEFMVILDHLIDRKEIERAVDQIRSELRKIFIIKGIKIKITTSVGLTQFPKDGNNAEQLVRNVEQSMCYSKKRGRNCYSFFNKAMQKEALYKINLIKDLRKAVQQKQFELHYQPIIDLTTNTITKAESLIRWSHPERGSVSPAEFIPLAEEIGLINEIGNWVFKTSIDQTVKVHNSFDKSFQMSINTSPLQYHKNGMEVSAWYEYVESRGLSGDSIVVEITEGVLMKTTKSVVDNLHKLRRLSIRVAIDDFGTGYSSLAYLKKLDVDFLKIDQSFVKGLTSNSDEFILIEAITIMAHKLGIKVIAEGVETERQRDLLVEIGCDFGQGFYFSKPLHSDKFLALLGNWEQISFHENSQKELPFI